MVPVDEPEEDDEEDEVYEFVEEETEQKSNPIPPTEDEVREHNLGTAENPQPNRLPKTLPSLLALNHLFLNLAMGHCQKGVPLPKRK